MADWSELDKYLLEMIGEKLNLYPDYVRFRAVCNWWKSSLPKTPRNLPHQFPCLMLPPQSQDKPNHTHSYGFLSIFIGDVYQLEFPEFQDKLFRGSSHGWIVTVEIEPFISLINPLTRAQIQLPPITTFPELLEYHPDRVGKEYLVRSVNLKSYYNSTLTSLQIRRFFVQKVILSSSPSTTHNYTAMAIYGDTAHLGVCKLPGDKRWTKVASQEASYGDIVFYKDKFYAVDCNGCLHVIVDLDSDSPRAVQIATTPTGYPLWSKPYLVEMESSGVLLLVGRHVDYPSATSYKTLNFWVYKLNLNSTSSQGNWSQLDTLGDYVLFLGCNQSLSFAARNFPGCTGDCIYFSDDNLEGQRESLRGGADLGVFNYKNKTFHPLPGYQPHSQVLWPSPIWVIPSA